MQYIVSSMFRSHFSGGLGWEYSNSHPATFLDFNWITISIHFFFVDTKPHMLCFFLPDRMQYFWQNGVTKINVLIFFRSLLRQSAFRYYYVSLSISFRRYAHSQRAFLVDTYCAFITSSNNNNNKDRRKRNKAGNNEHFSRLHRTQDTYKSVLDEIMSERTSCWIRWKKKIQLENG